MAHSQSELMFLLTAFYLTLLALSEGCYSFQAQSHHHHHQHTPSFSRNTCSRTHCISSCNDCVQLQKAPSWPCPGRRRTRPSPCGSPWASETVAATGAAPRGVSRKMRAPASPRRRRGRGRRRSGERRRT
uniref:CLPX n=1 Tax=Arundo donax TaxID=35708 RepID=A0A0A9HDC9_ARUDO